MKKIKITKYLITTLITSLVLSLYWVTTYASEQKISPTTKIIKHIEEYKINNDLEMSRKMNETKDNISILSKEDLLNQFKTETIQKGKETLKYLSSEEVINYNGLIEQSQSKEDIDNIFNKFLELNNQKAEQHKKKEENKKSAVVETKKETTSNYRSSVVLSNGNTPGEIGTYAAIKMEEATGVSRTIWEQIIARESNGNPNAVNPSGASGLFQTIPLWGPTDTVEAQINSALRAYNEALRYFGNGLQPWGF